MNKYQKGIIYIIIDISKDWLPPYYGSTTQDLEKRMVYHRYVSNPCSSKAIIDKGLYIYSVVERYPCNSKKELERREGWYIKNNNCINKRIEGRTIKEWKEDNKELVRERSKGYMKVYRKNNKERIKERDSKYGQKYYQNNKEKRNKQIKAWNHTRVNCIHCDELVKRHNLTYHIKNKCQGSEIPLY